MRVDPIDPSWDSLAFGSLVGARSAESHEGRRPESYFTNFTRNNFGHFFPVIRNVLSAGS